MPVNFDFTDYLYCDIILHTLIKDKEFLDMTEPIDNTKINTGLDNSESLTFNMSQTPFTLYVEINEPNGVENIIIGQYDNYESAQDAHIELLSNINNGGFLVITFPDGSIVSFPKHKINHIHLAQVEIEQ